MKGIKTFSDNGDAENSWRRLVRQWWHTTRGCLSSKPQESVENHWPQWPI